MQKISSIHQFILEIQQISQPCNLISQEHFASYLRNRIFFQVCDLCRNITNNIKFHYRPNSGKINDQIFQKNVLTHFPHYLEKKSQSRTPCQNLGKTNGPIRRKRLDRRTDRQTLFHKTLSATSGVPKLISSAIRISDLIL